MSYRYLNEETDEIRNAIEDTLQQIKTNREARRALQDQDKKLRQQLMHTMELMDLADGDSLISNDLGIKAIIYPMRDGFLSKDLLMNVGVPEELIEKAKEFKRNQQDAADRKSLRIQDYPSEWGSKYIKSKT